MTTGDVIAGQVTAAVTGAPVAGATVEAVGSAGTDYDAQTDSNGFYTVTGLADDTYTLVVAANGLAEAEITGLNVTAAMPATQNVALSPQATITGTLNLASGGPTGGVPFVEAVPTGSTDPYQDYYGTFQGTQFTVPNLPPGTYALTVSENGYVAQNPAAVTVTAGGTQAVGTLTLAPAASVTGTVVQMGTTTPDAYDVVFASAARPSPGPPLPTPMATLRLMAFHQDRTHSPSGHLPPRPRPRRHLPWAERLAFEPDSSAVGQPHAPGREPLYHPARERHERRQF